MLIAQRLLDLARTTPQSILIIDPRSGRAEIRKTQRTCESEYVTEILAAARHEAGHAFADSALFGPGISGFATLEHEGELHGYTERTRSDRPPLGPGVEIREDGAFRLSCPEGNDPTEFAEKLLNRLINAIAISAYAGGASELFAPFAPSPCRWVAGQPLSNPVRKKFDAASLSDRMTLEHNARVLAGLEFPALKLGEGFLAKTLEVLGKYWPDVETIAAELCEHGTVSGKRVDEIVWRGE
jgi:hypothetical protein